MFTREKSNMPRWQRTSGETSHQHLGDPLPPPTFKVESTDDSQRVVIGKQPTSGLQGFAHRRSTNRSPGRDDGSHSRDRRLDPLGLTVLHEPKSTPCADIVFVHGLGGSSRQTWCKNRDPILFWPLEWLSRENVISSARISSFGYNAHFLSLSGRKNVLNISDFAKELLFHLRFATGKGEIPLNIGRVPLIFVAHSMGGLVVKKALILGQNDPNYGDIVDSISAIVFLSTPHRGSDLAETLNTLLSACVLTFSRKEYIAELRANSPALLEINDQFRNLVARVELFSFYETQPTKIAGVWVNVLQRDSSTLGYPDEICTPLTADHHDVCKFSSQEDPNYVIIRDTIKYLIAKCMSPVRIAQPPPEEDAVSFELDELSEAMNHPDTPIDDLEYFADKRLTGSCSWILEAPEVSSFLELRSSEPLILWLSGKPGSGKSVVASFLVSTLQQYGMINAFYFFRFGNQVKNNLTSFLLSIAWQLASEIPEYRRRLVRLFDNGLNVRKTAPRLIWQQLFVGALLKTTIHDPVFVVVDGIDESDSASLLLKLFMDLSSSKVPLRFLLISRRTQTISVALEKLGKGLKIHSVQIDNAENDLRMYVEDEMEAMHGDSNFKQEICARILAKADGNFLWAHLVVNEILQCHTEDDVEEALNHVPEDLEPLYERMDDALAQSMKPTDRSLSQAILRWATCSRYPLTLIELESALRPDHPRVLDLEHTIRTVCGEFVIVDKRAHVTMIHSSARDFLMTKSDLNFYVNPPETHHALFTKCMHALSGTRSRGDVFRSNDDSPGLEFLKGPFSKGTRMEPESRSLLTYAATSWPHHLAASNSWADQESLILLSRFLQSQNILNWIFVLATTGRLRVLVQASKVMMDFLKDSDKLDSARSPLTHRLKEKSTVAEWSNDLVRVVGKFGSQLIHYPKTIFHLIPAFCPANSIIYRQFAQRSAVEVPVITGLSNAEWDDCLAKFTTPGSSMALKITTLDRYFSILTSDGTLRLYHTSTCDEARIFKHGERVLTMAFNTSGDRLATYGILNTKVWDTRTGRHLFSVVNPQRVKALTIIFSPNDELIFTCSDDRLVRSCNITEWQDGWDIVHDVFGNEIAEKSRYTSPQKVSFNAECSMVAIAFRGHALMVWSLNEPRPWLVGRCEGERERTSGSHGVGAATRSKVLGAHALCWNPMTGHVLGISNEGYIFKWHPFDQDYATSITRATNIKCSADGRYFVTSSRNGILRVWDFEHFTPIYKLSYAASVQDFAIDRNDIRIYDIRDKFCNVWEPSAVMQLLNSDERASETTSTYDSSLHTTSLAETMVDALEPVTTLSICSAHNLYAVGTDEGRISVFDTESRHLAELSERFMTIEHICWSEDGSMIASVDLSRSLSIDQITRRADGYANVNLFMATLPDSVHQILFDRTGLTLVVSTTSSIIFYSIVAQAIANKIPDTRRRKWINHPNSEDLLIGFSCDDIAVYRWSDGSLVMQKAHSIPSMGDSFFELRPEYVKRRPSESYPMTPGEITKLISKVLVSTDGQIVLVEISESTSQGRRRKQCVLMEMDSVTNDSEITAHTVPAEIRAALEVSLGFLNGDIDRIQPRRPSTLSHQRTRSSSSNVHLRHTIHDEHVIVFIDREFWVCTASITGDQVGTKIRRRFFLPRDWVNLDWLELATLTKDGKILCPRNGEVAVISNAFGGEWPD